MRQTLLRQHLVEQVIQLPRRVFKGTEAQAYLVVLSKMAGETEHVTLRQMGQDGQLSESIEIQQDAAAKRLDFMFHARVGSARRSGDGSLQISVGDALTSVVRGTICSSSISTFPAPVFHLGDFTKPVGEHAIRIVPKRFALSARAAQRVAQDARLALPGDILIARVGRALEEHVALVVHGALRDQRPRLLYCAPRMSIASVSTGSSTATWVDMHSPLPPMGWRLGSCRRPTSLRFSSNRIRDVADYSTRRLRSTFRRESGQPTQPRRRSDPRLALNASSSGSNSFRALRKRL